MNLGKRIFLTNEDELHTKLCSIFGLTSNEARLYILMLENDYFTASELSELSGIHRSRIYDNLRGLEAKKLINCTDRNPLKFRIVPPQEAVSHISEELIREHQQQLEEINEFGFLLETEIQKRNKVFTSKPHVVPLDDAILELRSLLESAKRRVWVTKRTSGGVVDWFALRTDLARLLAEGIDIRFLSDRNIGFPFKLKVNTDVSLSFSIIDDIVVSFLIPTQEEADGQIFVTRNPEFVKFFERTFEEWWYSPD